jgi:uncharacterized surface anchored protein
VDNDASDADKDDGQFELAGARLGSYVITETVAPAGFALDVDATRAQAVTALDLNAVVGTQGVDDPGTTDESDFHNRLGSLSWEKRGPDNVLQGGATFTVGPNNPFTGVAGALTVVDNDASDADKDDGQFELDGVRLGSYVITETVAPAGYGLDADATRAQAVTALDLNAVVGTQGVDDPGTTDESDFHNRLGSLSWEKRGPDNVLQGGATFTVGPNNPFTGVAGALTVVDNDASDADKDDGQFELAGARLGSYVITETVAPAGFALDADATRAQAVTALDLNAVVGTQGVDDPGTTDESDFHNRLGSLSWEKRGPTGALLAGATFSVTPDPSTGTGSLTGITDCVASPCTGLADQDPDAGQFGLVNVRLGSYTITETVAPTGFVLDADATRAQAVTPLDLNAVVGTQGVDDPGTTDESDFHNGVALHLGKTRGFWGNVNGHGILDPDANGLINSPVTIGGGTRSVSVTSIVQSDKILGGNACTFGIPTIFTCTGTGAGQGLSDALKVGTLNNLAAQTLALTYNIQKIGGYSGQTLGALSCSPVTGLTSSSTVNDALVLANSLIQNSVFGGTTTQAQASAMNTLLGDCLNREI